MIQKALWLENLTYSATDMRRLISAVFGTTGILHTGELAVSQHAGGANMSVDVAAGSAILAGTSVAGQGNYLFNSDAVVNVTIAAAPGTGNSRIDLIVAKVQDVDTDGGVTNAASIVAVTGTPASTGSQVAPSAPANSTVLAQVAVGPSVSTIVTANITDERGFAGSSRPTPAGRIVQTTAQTLATSGDLTNFGLDYAVGGMLAQATSGTGELIVPVAGIYEVKAQIAWNVSSVALSAAQRYEAFLQQNGTPVRRGEGGANSGTFASGAIIMSTVTDDINLSAGDVLSLHAQIDGSLSSAITLIGTSAERTTYLSARLASHL